MPDIFQLQLLQALGIGDIHAAKLATPKVITDF